MPRPADCHTSGLLTPNDKEQALQVSVSWSGFCSFVSFSLLRDWSLNSLLIVHSRAALFPGVRSDVSGPLPAPRLGGSLGGPVYQCHHLASPSQKQHIKQDPGAAGAFQKPGGRSGHTVQQGGQDFLHLEWFLIKCSPIVPQRPPSVPDGSGRSSHLHPALHWWD